MKKIINWVIGQEHDTIDNYPSLAEPLSKEFGIDLGVAKGIMNTIIEWECGTGIDTLEDVLNKEFPSVTVTF